MPFSAFDQSLLYSTNYSKALNAIKSCAAAIDILHTYYDSFCFIEQTIIFKTKIYFLIMTKGIELRKFYSKFVFQKNSNYLK
jgi:hypothetical protein